MAESTNPHPIDVAHLAASYQYMGLRTISSLDLYFNRYLATGARLRAILENDLANAITQSVDEEALEELPDVVRFLVAHAPEEAWGSRAIVNAWLKRRKTPASQLA